MPPLMPPEEIQSCSPASGLPRIREELFYGSSRYTKNQPDLFVPHRFKMMAPSQAGVFVETLKESIKGDREILLYFHLPFCSSECLFCNSFPLQANKQVQQDYLQHLLKEIDLFAQAGFFDGKQVRCLYFGGGTPTTFHNRDLKLIIERIRSSVDLAVNCSMTTEAHPVTLGSEERIEGLARIGFNRISIGCQTFDPEVLRHCHRSNTESQVRQVVASVQQAGLAINVDMMTGLPGQTLASVRRDLEILGEIRPNAVEYIRHEIVNPLIVDLYRSRPDLMVKDDALFEMVLMTQGWMKKHGYEQNGRISDDRQWGYRYHWLKEMPIIAFGSRSRSYTRTICYDKHEDLSIYTHMIDRGIPPIARYFHLSKKDQMYRSLMLGLQLRSGLDIRQFHDSYREMPAAVFALLLARLDEYGCLVQDAAGIRLTEVGACFVEDVCDFVIDAALQDEPGNQLRAPHSGGSRYSSPPGADLSRDAAEQPQPTASRDLLTIQKPL